MIKPLNGRVVLKEVEKPDIVSNGVILTQRDETNNFQAEVVAIAEDVIDIEFKVGEKVFIDKELAEKNKQDDVEYLIVKADDILGVWE